MKNFFVFLIGALIGAALVYFFLNKTDADEELVAPKGIITPSQAKVLDRAFDSRHQLISDSIVKTPDNRSSWYSLSDVRAYLNYAEKEASGIGYKMDGVRIYLGAHTNTSTQVGYTTMFLVPTGYEATADASMNFLNLNFYSKPPDIPGGSGLDMGSGGDPPGTNYGE